MLEVDCESLSDISGWVIASTVGILVICFFGVICNVITLICLFHRQMKKAMKIQLMTIFGLQAAVCMVTLPFVTYLYYNHAFCLEEPVIKEVEFFFTIVHSILLQGERLCLTVVAVYRAVAVIRPHCYQIITETKIVIPIQIGIFIVIVPPWTIFGILKNSDFSETVGDVMRYEGTYAMVLYCIYYLLPMIVTSIAYVCTVLTIAHRNCQADEKKTLRETPNNNNLDNVARTLLVLILTNLLLDGPHVIFHMLPEHTELASNIVHAIFSCHLLLDPVIFVGMNKSDRQQFVETVRQLALRLPGIKRLSHQSRDTDDLALDQIE